MLEGSNIWDRLSYSLNDVDLYISYYSLWDIVISYGIVSLLLLWVYIYVKRVGTLIASLTLLVPFLWLNQNVLIYQDRVAAWSSYSLIEVYQETYSLSVGWIGGLLLVYIVLMLVTLRGYHYVIYRYQQYGSGQKIIRKYLIRLVPIMLLLLFIYSQTLFVVGGYVLFMIIMATTTLTPYLSRRYEIKMNRLLGASVTYQ